MRRLALVTLLLCLLGPGVAQPAAAAAGCTAHVTKLRYRPEITWNCAGNVLNATAVVKRVSTHAVVGADPVAGAGTTRLTLDLRGDLASAATYAVTLTYDDGGGPATLKTTWKTLPRPAHPALHVKYITAIPPPAVLDIAHRMDAANLLAVPRPSDFIDASTTTLSAAQYTTALRAHQSALVVTDGTVKNPGALGTALAQYCNHGHGVVLGGQTHWLKGHEGWQTASAIGGQTSAFAAKWAMYTYDDVFPDHVSTGAHQLAPGSVQPHFLTRGLTKFTVIGPGSGEPIIQDYASGHMLATLQHEPSGSPFHTFPQVFLAERQIGAGRVVDLGFRPWSSAVADGGFDPAKSAGGALTARSLWWATNRIPPTGTHFSLKPGNPSNRATVVFDLAAKDADPDGFRDLRFRYRVDRGSWHWAVGNSFVLYHLAQGSVHTVYGRAVDSGGNVDAHAAHYTFRVAPGALG
jgi:hypothetical protein